MKLIIQKVKEGQVRVAGEVIGGIGKGAVVFIGMGKDDTVEDVNYCAEKLINLRMFDGPEAKGEYAAHEVDAEFLLVSQFTLMASLNKGRRPSYDGAADPQTAENLYNLFVQKMQQGSVRVATGKFRAMMEVKIVNDGPVTFILESKK